MTSSDHNGILAGFSILFLTGHLAWVNHSVQLGHNILLQDLDRTSSLEPSKFHRLEYHMANLSGGGKKQFFNSYSVGHFQHTRFPQESWFRTCPWGLECGLET